VYLGPVLWLGDVEVMYGEPRLTGTHLFAFMSYLQNAAFYKWAMLDLNQRPPPCKF